MATTTSGISFEEAEGSPTIDISLNGLSAQRKFVIDWADWDAFAQEAYGIYRTIAGGQVVFIAPIAFPGNRPWLFPDTMRVEPYAGAVNGASVVSLSSGTNAYNKALVTVNYRERFDDRKSHPNSPDVPKGTYLTYNGDLGTEILATQPRAWLWENLAEPVEQDIPTVVVIPTNNFSLTWHRVPSPPHGKIGSHRGKISSSTFMGAPAGCTLFLGARMQAAFQISDDPVLWTVEYHFAEKRHFSIADRPPSAGTICTTPSSMPVTNTGSGSLPKTPPAEANTRTSPRISTSCFSSNSCQLLLLAAELARRSAN